MNDAKKKSKDKPGSSNAGKYKTKGPYCGPAGGAAKGTYPVNTRKRAVAALAYARHAPNPAGIRRCVCRHWPSLPACKKKKGKKGDAEDWTVDTIGALDEIRALYKDGKLSVEGVFGEIMDIWNIEMLGNAELAEVLKYIMLEEDVNAALDALREFISGEE